MNLSVSDYHKHYNYDPLVLKYIINYICVPHYYLDDANTQNDYLFYINVNIMEQIFNNITTQYDCNNIYHYNDFIKKLLIIYEYSIDNDNIYYDYNKILDLLPILPGCVLYDYMFYIFRIRPELWQMIVHPETLQEYLKQNDDYSIKCNKMRYEEMKLYEFCAPTDIINNIPSINGIILVCNYIYSHMYKTNNKIYDYDLFNKYGIGITKHYINCDSLNNMDDKTFIDVIKYNVCDYDNIIKIVYTTWSFNNNMKRHDFQYINKTQFLLKNCNDLQCLLKMWWLCSATYNEREHKMYLRSITYSKELSIQRTCESYNTLYDICPYNIKKTRACNTHCMINEKRHILTDSNTIRMYYNPLDKKQEKVTNILCGCYICKSETYVLKTEILLCNNTSAISLEDHNFIINNSKIIDYLNTIKIIEICNIIGCCCKEKTYSLTYVTLPKDIKGFYDLVSLYNSVHDEINVTKQAINKYVKHNEYCYTCATVILAYMLKNAKKLFKITHNKLYHYMEISSYQIKNLEKISTFIVLYDNVNKIKKRIPINIDLIKTNINGNVIVSDEINYIKKVNTNCNCKKCLSFDFV